MEGEYLSECTLFVDSCIHGQLLHGIVHVHKYLHVLTSVDARHLGASLSEQRTTDLPLCHGTQPAGFVTVDPNITHVSF